MKILTPYRPPRLLAGAFSLVELLTVIAIIVLLIGILVPAVNKVRESARRTSTESAIATIATALEAFRADQQIGGAYPPSASDWAAANGTLLYRVNSPYRSLAGTPPPATFQISGAGLLVWALAGADLTGCPGFRTFRDGLYWGQDTDNDPADPPGAYALDPTTLQPLRPRVGPLVDLSKVEVTRWNPGAANGGSFEIPVELKARDALGTPPANMPLRNYPMFLDAFGGPILYWRADRAGLRIADRSPSDNDAAQEARGIYHFADNSSLLEDGGQLEIKLSAGARAHRLWGNGFNYPAPLRPDELDQEAEIRAHPFPAYIRNSAVQAKVTPHNADSFLLVSPGADGIYGSGDDVANFPHNGAELREP